LDAEFISHVHIAKRIVTTKVASWLIINAIQLKSITPPPYGWDKSESRRRSIRFTENCFFFLSFSEHGQSLLNGPPI
jgi:hypothetical protein